MTRVLLAGGGTGGHLYPALSIGAALQAERPGTELHFVGALRGVEARVLPQEGVPHTLLPLEPLRRSRPWENWRLVPSVLRSAAGLRRLFSKFRPDLFVGTGGYASGPAGLMAQLFRVPVAVQEQNSFPGLTTRWLARRARQVFLGFPEARAHLAPGDATEIFEFGNPIRPPDPALERGASRRSLGLDPAGVVALVVGGSQGAKAVNDTLLAALERVASGALPAPPADVQLLWATGPAHEAPIAERLRPLALGWVHPRGYIDDMPAALAASDVAVSRAGAIMTAELQAWGIPALLVPLPTAAADHQTHNARALAEAGAAIMVPQSELSPERLWDELRGLLAAGERRSAMAAAARERGRPDAARRIARKLLELAEEGR